MLAGARGIDCVEVDLAVVRGEREPELRLFAARPTARRPTPADRQPTERETRMSATDAVLTEPRDGVLVITINRPDQRNAVNGAVAEGIAAALDQLDGDDGLVLGVLTGAGGLLRRHGPQGVRGRGESLRG